MDRYTAAAMGQNVSEIGNTFMQMNDPRTRAQAGLLRAQLLGQTAENEGRGITNSFLPRTLQSSIDQNNAAAAANLAQGRNYDATAANTGTRTRAANTLLGAAAAFPEPIFTEAGMPDSELGGALPPLNWQNGPRGHTGDTIPVIAPPDGIAPSAPVMAPQTPTAAAQFAPAPVVQQFTPEQLAIFANVASGSGGNDMGLGLGRAAALGSQTEMDARRAGLAITGNAFGQGEYFDPASSNAYQANDIAGAFARGAQTQEGMNIRKSADIIAGGAPGGTSASSAGAAGPGRNPLDSVQGAEFTQARASEIFGMQDESGKLSVSPENAAAMNSWQTSVANLTEAGVPIQTAISIANESHNTAAIGKAGDGWWDGDPRMQIGKDFNYASITPEGAQTYAIGNSFGPQTAPGGGGARMFAAGMLNPQIASLVQQAAPAPSEQPAAAMIPPMLQRAPDAIPQTGPARASDEFRPRESSEEKKANDTKASKIKTLESGIAEITQRLKSGRISTPAPMLGGGMGGAFSQPSSSPLSNDGYNAQLARLKQMEAELSALQAPTAQKVSGNVGRFTVISE